ncbi:MAG TPA: hypothetical protein VMT10_05890 [Solirubrobacteraceae bacterium]|nr:hypothetical protein [Solirubrobacteraceae bacterium]
MPTAIDDKQSGSARVHTTNERSGDLRAAPKRLGGGGLRALGKAPGTYVLAS